jgi:DNA gyrase subunit A
MEVIADGGDILFATENGYGKKVSIADFRIAHRGGMGVRTIPTDKRYGLVIGLTIVHPNSNLLLIDQAGKIIRLPATEVRTMGRQAKGVRLIRLDEGQKLSRIVAFSEEDDDEEGSETKSKSGNPAIKMESGEDQTLAFLGEEEIGEVKLQEPVSEDTDTFFQF